MVICDNITITSYTILQLIFHLHCFISFIDVIYDLYHVKDQYSNETKPVINEKYYNIIQNNANKLNSAIIYDRDFSYNYFGFKTLERSYLLKIRGKVVERPQHMLMRVAVAIHGEDIEKAIETYNFLSERYFTHASPTLFSACTIQQQMSRYSSRLMYNKIYLCNEII